MLWLWGCSAHISDTFVEDTASFVEDSTHEEFSILFWADPHVYGEGEHQERLQKVVDWCNTNQEDDNIQFVVVLGDVGWEAGLAIARDTLSTLTIPYVPLIGDNEVHFGDEQRFFSVFADVYEQLSTKMTDWSDSFVPVWNPEFEQESMFGNLSFSYRGIRFLGLDWASRSSNSILGEMGDIHDFEGGTLPWLSQELAFIASEQNPIFLMTHIPMYVNAGAFDLQEMSDVELLLSPYADLLQTNFAGHYHVDSFSEQELYDVVILDAIWDDEIRFQQLHVQRMGAIFSFHNEIVVLE